MAMVQALVGLKNRLRPDIFARAEIASWALAHVEQCGQQPARILDVGLGGAEDLLALRSAASGEVTLYGIECHPARIERARARGIEVFAIDLEHERIPLPDACLDVLMANHVVEHLKELFFFFSEVSRVLRPGGMCIIGFPNLGGWHNRLALLFGQQPPCMRVLGSHVRGITIPGFRRFIECGGFFRVQRVKGRAFYLAPRGVSRVLAEIVPGLCSAVHFVLTRTDKPGAFIEVLDMNIPGIQDTPYFRGSS
ncbi:class I SAM-dependent methyltransferase [Piscinibacter sp. XHJ-5]|uniref:class I SAM-dependent methyltransferase n=1 Tax=Piscinibacter sp. XHJ-5 TaxID=3037797 RepID=UPI002452B5E7|nr:class I SAM-dependent methyltransferase [Piscinibacter sp. XHJ-5]